MSDELKYDPNIIDPPIKIIKKEKTQENENNITEINDIRSSLDFKGVTFSNYKKTEVKEKLINTIHNQDIEPACYWCAEYICAGHFGELWEILLYYVSKYIHLGNPKIAIYLQMRYNTFRNIMNQTTIVNELDARNNEKIRKLFAEIICSLAISEKKPGFEQIKINSASEYDITKLSNKLKATDTSFVKENFKKKDPKELFVAMNEFGFALSEKNMLNACYWIEWTLEFENICKKRKQIIKCESRHYKIESKYKTNSIWIIWDILLDYATSMNNEFILKTMEALNSLFCIKYTEACAKRRRYLLYYAVGLLTETSYQNKELVINRILLQNVINKIEEIYKQIKKNEVAPKTDYLFKGLDKKKAIEKSLKQLEIVNSIVKNSSNK